MNLQKCLATKNECYQRGVGMTPVGVMVHSTGANNPWLKRYVQPNDGLLGTNNAGNHLNQYRPGGRQVCVHAFIGKLADGSIATYQTLPWAMRGWHSGVGSKGSANNMGYIGFEICEDGLTDPVYFRKVYQEAVELTAYLCKLYNPAHDKKVKAPASKSADGNEITVHIKGMMCEHCENRIKAALEALPNVESADVSHKSGTAILTLKGDIKDGDIKKAVEDAGYKVKQIEKN